MFIVCEFCGSTYDVNLSHECPNCGAEAGNNTVIQEQIKQQNRIQEYNTRCAMERERMATEEAQFISAQRRLEMQRLKQKIKSDKTARTISNGISLGCSLPFIIVGILVAIFIIMGIYNGLKEGGFFETFDTNTSTTTIAEETIPETPCEVKINETAELSYCSVVCNKFEKINPYPWSTAKNCDAYEIQLVIKNTTNESIYFDDKTLCIADGYQCKEMNTPSAMEQVLSEQNIEGGLKTQGSICFEIPKDAKDVVLKYGDYITIKLK